MSPTPDRLAASRVLLRMLGGAGRLDAWVAQEACALRPEERRRVHALTYGVARNKTLLCCHLDPLLARPLSAQDLELQAVLLLGTYELLFQDSVPERASVHEAVELARAIGRPRQAGLVNAVLRTIARRKDPPVMPARETEPLAWAERVASHPHWIVQEMASGCAPDEVADWAEADNAEPPLWLRLRDADDEDVVQLLGAARSGHVSGAVLLAARPRGPVERLPGFGQGRWWVQDLGAQAVVAMAGIGPGARVLDACAAPGGKTLAAAALAGREGSVVAMDRSADRLALLDDALRRMDLPGVLVEERDLLAAPMTEARFDRVLLDAPCSGLGVIRRHPEVRWNRRLQDVQRHAAAQRALLLAVADAVVPGGVLVYSVCTFTRAETTEVVQDFLRRRPDYAMAAPGEGAPDACLLDGPALRTRPHLHDADSFFAVRLARAGGCG